MTAEMSLAGSALVMTLIVAARYLAISGGFAWITRVRRPGLYDDKANQIRREIGWSLSAAAIYGIPAGVRSEEHTSELQSLMRISYAVFCLKKKTHKEQQ